MTYSEFRVLPEHITLLRKSRVSWNPAQNGAACIDTKYPYGHSDLVRSTALLLGVPVCSGEDLEPFTEESREHVRRLHRQTETVLSIVLSTGQMSPGLYRRPTLYSEWERVSD